MKRRLLIAALLFFPLSVSAATLANCDSKSYEVTINNGGESRTVLLTPNNGVIREYGMVLSFKLPDHPAVVVHEPDEEYCIWSGKITLQHINSSSNAGSGNSLR